MREPGEFVLADGVLGRAVESSVIRRRRGRREQRYLHVNWDITVAAMVRMNTDHTARLWLVIQLQTKLERPVDGWIKPRRQLLDQIELPHSIRDVIVRLERAGLIEVQRQPNKRALVRLATRPVSAAPSSLHPMAGDVKRPPSLAHQRTKRTKQ